MTILASAQTNVATPQSGVPFVVRRASYLVAEHLQLEELRWFDKSTTKPACLGRKIVMYLLVVGLGLMRQRVSELVGRHHSTVEHAVRSIEERRDDAKFDAEMTRMELELRLSTSAEDLIGS